MHKKVVFFAGAETYILKYYLVFFWSNVGGHFNPIHFCVCVGGGEGAKQLHSKKKVTPSGPSNTL